MIQSPSAMSESPPSSPFEDYPHMTPLGEHMEHDHEPVFSRRNFVKAGLIATVAGSAGIFVAHKARQALHPYGIALSYRDPNMTEPIIMDSHNRYPYTRSALSIHTDAEKRFLPQGEGLITQLTTIEDNIANRVAQRVHETVKGQSIQESLHTVGSTPQGLSLYMKLIAEEHIRAGCICDIRNPGGEGSFADAIDPHKNYPGTFNLDCDLLSNGALHAASRHDIPLHAVFAPNHVYVGSPQYAKFAREMTAFRRPILFHPLTGYPNRPPLVPNPQDEVHPRYISSHKTQKDKWIFSSPEIEEMFGFFKPINEKRLQEISTVTALLELMEQVQEDAHLMPSPPTIEYMQTKREELVQMAEKEWERLNGGMHISIITYGLHKDARFGAIHHWFEESDKNKKEKLYQDALQHAQRMIDIREDQCTLFDLPNFQSDDEEILALMQQKDLRTARDLIMQDMYKRRRPMWRPNYDMLLDRHND
jgi:hypothetical protein